MNTFGTQLQPALGAPTELLRLDLCLVEGNNLITTLPVGVLSVAEEERLYVLLWHRRQKRKP